MRICLTIIMALGLTSCEQKEVAQQESGPAKRDVVIQDAELGSAYALDMEEYTGLPANLLPPYRYGSIQKNGNNEYIYVLGDDNKAQWAILIYSSPDASRQAFQIYKETPTEGGVKRSPITATELSTHLNIIEKRLIEHYGEEMYRRYYTEGLPTEEDEDFLLINTANQDDLSLDEVERHAAEALAEETLYHIAHLIHYLRATLNSR